MSKEEIIEGNKLIAEFMGWSKHPKYGEDYIINKDKNRKIPPHWTGINHEGKLSDFDYHSSWDWLMPVVEKIDGLSTIETEDLSIENLTIFSEKEMVWECVIHFIKWYNQQSKL